MEAGLGKVHGIVGPNGSGKSTLLRLMAGILRPTEGEVSIEGSPLSAFSRRELARKAAFLPQQAAASFDLLARDVVSLGRYPHQQGLGFPGAEDEVVVERVMRETECENLADRYLSTLSGGERQRVMIASILAQEPKVLLLDEPSSSLDIHHKAHIFGLLSLLSRREMAVVLVTHDLNMAAEYCDQLFLISEGMLLHQGSPGQVMRADILSQAYGAELRVATHPLTGAPLVASPRYGE